MRTINKKKCAIPGCEAVDVTKACPECSRWFCTFHTFTMPTCDGCGYDICIYCRQKCAICGKWFCEDCIETHDHAKEVNK